MNIRDVVERALNAARQKRDKGNTPAVVHRNRSKSFVEALAREFCGCCESRSSVRVLCKHDDTHRSEFGMNELLFDILVCDTSEVQSARDVASLTFVSEALWAVESEFAEDTRQAIYDFNKLVLASAHSKLFVGSLVTDESSYLGVLLEPAKRCSGDVFVALVPHPREWGEDHLTARIYELRKSAWKSIAADRE